MVLLLNRLNIFGLKVKVVYDFLFGVFLYLCFVICIICFKIWDGIKNFSCFRNMKIKKKIKIN